MRLFNFDLHISVIEDLKHIFKELGHEIDSRCISGHNWVFNNATKPLEVVNQYNWQQLSPDMCNAFYNRYKDELNQYDGFVVTYPPSFALLYEKFNKPIIIHVPIRYETPFNMKPQLWEWFNEYLRKGIDNKQIFVIGNSVYDQKYCEFFLNRKCQYIPNLCDYGNTYPQWTGTKNEFLLFNDSKLQLVAPCIQDRHQLHKPYKWENIEAHKGIIHIPYNSSTMSTYEQYTANTPLLFPSCKFLIELMARDTNVLCGLTWNQYHNAPPTAGDHPNNYKDMAIMGKWIPLAEYYTESSMPYIIYFDSFPHLKDILQSNMNYQDISDQMKIHNIQRREWIFKSWKTILCQI